MRAAAASSVSSVTGSFERDGELLACVLEAAYELLAVEGLAPPVLLHDPEEALLLKPLVGRKAVLALGAFAPPAVDAPFVGALIFEPSIHYMQTAK